MTVTVKKIGGSLALIVPKSIAAESRLTEGASLEISSTPAGLLFRHADRRQRRSIADIVARIKPKTYARRNHDFSADEPAGKECW